MPAISVNNVSKTFRTKTGPVKALDSISFNVSEGEMFGLLGPNGAGKSTLINVMLNLLEPDSGEVLILGQKPGPEVLRQINVVSGGSYFHEELTPNDILRFYARLYDVPDARTRIDEIARILRMEKLMDRKFSWFSTGERLRVAFAKALLNRPRVLLLDEPTLGLDPDVARAVRKHILEMNKQGTTILLTSHYMHEVEQLCKRIAFISGGKIVDVGEVKKIKLRHFNTYDVVLTLNKKPTKKYLEANELKAKGNKVKATLSSEEALSTLIASTHTQGFGILDVSIRKPSLEDYFIKMLGDQK